VSSSVRWIAVVSLVLVSATAAVAAQGQETILVEAEGFDDLGGWVIDQQYMDQMGSPVVLAHGLGRPVKDAVTAVELPAAGDYRVWVRTRDWAATFNAPGTPGRFKVLVNGKALAATFGTEGAAWHWQDGGAVTLPNGKATLALHDLTGFDGRCDAIVLTRDPRLAPPNAGEAMAAWRRSAGGCRGAVRRWRRRGLGWRWR